MGLLRIVKNVIERKQIKSANNGYMALIELNNKDKIYARECIKGTDWEYINLDSSDVIMLKKRGYTQYKMLHYLLEELSKEVVALGLSPKLSKVYFDDK